MNNADVGKLVEALREAVTTAITKGLTPRNFEHAVTWWEPDDENRSTGQTVLRRAKDFRFVARMLHAEPSMVQLRSLANDIRKIKWPESLADETAVGAPQASALIKAALHPDRALSTARVNRNSSPPFFNRPVLLCAAKQYLGASRCFGDFG